MPADNALWLVDTTARLRGRRVDRRAAPHDPDRRLHQRAPGRRRRHPRRHDALGLVRRPRLRPDRRRALRLLAQLLHRDRSRPVRVPPEARRRRRVPGRVVPVAARGHRPEGRGLQAPALGLFFGKGKINPYDYDTNTLGATITIPGDRRRDAGHDVQPRRRVPVRRPRSSPRSHPTPPASSSTRSTPRRGQVVPNWTLDLTPFGVLDPRSVEVIGDQIYVGDGGTRAGRRPAASCDLRVRRERPRRCSRPPRSPRRPPRAQFPLPVQFTDTSTGGPTSWAWDFGDGATSNLANPTHTYAAAGQLHGLAARRRTPRAATRPR